MLFEVEETEAYQLGQIGGMVCTLVMGLIVWTVVAAPALAVFVVSGK